MYVCIVIDYPRYRRRAGGRGNHAHYHRWEPPTREGQRRPSPLSR
jgi:hypothetical protein